MGAKHIGAQVRVYFTDFFGVAPSALKRYGAFDISLISDLPVFIDPFLLFGSRRRVYKALHQEIIRYLVFLREEADSGELSPGLVRAWYAFKEVNQLWLGFTARGNKGSGLGTDFATNLHSSLRDIFSDFGGERITKSSHLEKVCLIRPGVGKDRISDFTSRLILRYLCSFTETFAKKHLSRGQKKRCVVDRVRFDYHTKRWMPGTFTLPYYRRDYVLLTPRDLLTKDDTWINRTDLIDRFEDIPPAISNEELRASVISYFKSSLPIPRPTKKKRRRRKPTKRDKQIAAARTIAKYPELVDYYIRLKEDHPAQAVQLSDERVEWAERVFVKQVLDLTHTLATNTPFYRSAHGTLAEARARLHYLKRVIEDQDGYRLFYEPSGEPIKREKDVQILYQLVWFGTPSDVNREPNNGRGPVDFKISRGSSDKSLVEFKLASNTALERNLQNQVEVYKKANDTDQEIKAIVFFSLDEEAKVKEILRRLRLDKSENVVLIDARRDNKPSGSRA
jgi:hypothetical protein